MWADLRKLVLTLGGGFVLQIAGFALVSLAIASWVPQWSWAQRDAVLIISLAFTGLVLFASVRFTKSFSSPARAAVLAAAAVYVLLNYRLI